MQFLWCHLLAREYDRSCLVIVKVNNEQLLCNANYFSNALVGFIPAQNIFDDTFLEEQVST